MPASTISRRPTSATQRGPGRGWNNVDDWISGDVAETSIILPASKSPDLSSSRLLICYRFEFDEDDDTSDELPDDAQIVGIRVHFDCRASADRQVVTSGLALTSNARDPDGRNRPDFSEFWPVPGATFCRGLREDHWQRRKLSGKPWTADDIRERKFGVILQVQNSLETDVTAYLSSLNIEVAYM